MTKISSIIQNNQITPKIYANKSINAESYCNAQNDRINLNNLPNSNYNRNDISFGASSLQIHKALTLPSIKPSSNELKYFCAGYPLLAAYVPPSAFSITKVDSHMATTGCLYMATTGCLPCSKITGHDYVNKVNLLVHLYKGETLVNSSERIRDRLLEEGARLENLELRHISGTLAASEDKIQAFYDFMDKLGLDREKQLVENSVFLDDFHSDGLILHSLSGQTYELKEPKKLFDVLCYALGDHFKNIEDLNEKVIRELIKEFSIVNKIDLKNIENFNGEEIRKLVKEVSIINRSHTIPDYYDPFLIEIK